MADMTADINKFDEPLPAGSLILILLASTFFFALLIFPVAGDWRWLEGWIFVGAFGLTNLINFITINAKNPRVLRNRSKLRKTGLTDETRQAASSDRFIMPVLGISGYAALLIPGVGHRFGWYELPFAVALMGTALSITGMWIMHAATLQNSYASKILDINAEQTLVDTGLYGYVRHPMYAGGALMFLFLPVALGSLWGLIPAVIAVLSLVWRIEFEEEMLLKGMEGYAAYRERVRYKLIPGVY